MLKVCGKRLFTSIASPKNELEERESERDKNVDKKEILFRRMMGTPYIYRHHRVFCFNKTKEKTEREKGGQRGTPTSGVLTHSRWVIKFER